MTQNRESKSGFEEMGEAVGRMAGQAAGQAADMAMNVAGTVLNTAFQALGSWFSGSEAQQASRSFEERADRACREHFEVRVGSTGDAQQGAASPSYDNARPAYQFGHVAGHNPEYRGKQFDEVEAELQRAWESAAQGTGSAGWSEMRDYVNYGYTTRVEGAPNPS
jgi:hypothetical protein